MTQTPVAAPVAASPTQLSWLEREVATWVADDLISAAAGAAIEERYVAVRRFSLNRLVVNLGAGFVGVGLIWLVATNLDELGPGLRFAALTAIWFGLVTAAELLADRMGRSPLVGALRGLAGAAFGAVVFQAAQSLQVPAYEPSLVGVWGVGVLLYAYAVRAVAPLVVGASATAVWFVWEAVDSSESVAAGVLAVLSAAAATGGLAILHEKGLPGFASTWRLTGAVLMLGGLFVAALPEVDYGDLTWNRTLVAGVCAAAAVVAAAVVSGKGRRRAEALTPVAVVLVGVLLVLWEPPLPHDGIAAGEAWLSALVSVAVYVVVAGAVAVLGALRDSTALTALATGALVIFTVVQSFAVFAPIVSGATLFLLLGTILLATGYLFDRARREVTTNLEEALS